MLVLGQILIPNPGQVNFPLNLFFSGSDPVLDNRSIVLTPETVLEGWGDCERVVGSLRRRGKKPKKIVIFFKILFFDDSNKYRVLF